MNFHFVYYAVVLFIIVALLGIACKVKGQSKSPSAEIAYEIFVQSFCDSNGDGKGDLKGLISKLDYIQELGVTTIWLMPVHPSPSYHKYDVMDYYGIHPDYGTMADMDQLINAVHKRNMKIILDLVINHTSSQHPWFIASASATDNPFRNYYVWKDFEVVKDEINKKTTTFDSDNTTQWHIAEGQQDRYYGFFSERMPDLNFDYIPLREEIYKVGKFWLDKGIDGFRLDAAKHIFPDERLADTGKFWEEFTSKMRKTKPDVKIIGEVWSDPKTLATLFKGLPSLFNFELTQTIPASIKEKDPMKMIAPYRAMAEVYDSTKLPFEDAILLSNHDMNRIRSTLDGNVGLSKMAASILLTLPGTPYLYYGEEIGMLGMKPDEHIREPFLWSAESQEDTSWIQPTYTKIPDVTPLDEQLKDTNSLYHHYHTWIRLRKAHPALDKGTIDFIPPEFPHVLAYVRGDKRERIMVIHNLDTVEVEVRVMDPFTVMVGSPKQLDEHRMILSPVSSTLLLIGK